MTDATLVYAVLAAPLGAAALVGLMPTAAAADRLNLAASVLTAGLALALAAVALLAAPDQAASGEWYLVDAASGVFLALIAVIGLASAAVSPAHLRHAGRSWFSARRSRATYYAAFNLFWAVLIAVPLADNLGLAWILLEGSTAASALLIAFSGKASAVEAGWKYLVLTSLGLAFTLFGIVILSVRMAPGPEVAASLGWDRIAAGRPAWRARRSWRRSCSCSRGSRPRAGGPPSTTGCPTPTARRRRR